VTNEFDQIAQNENFTFLGNVKIGDDIKMNTLKKYFDMVCLCYGSGSENLLNIPGKFHTILIGQEKMKLSAQENL
jgi:NADPH-dependent glutamate synthase beta subunit-like oxidoreductase